MYQIPRVLCFKVLFTVLPLDGHASIVRGSANGKVEDITRYQNTRRYGTMPDAHVWATFGSVIIQGSATNFLSCQVYALHL
jgi:hypothetical protein